MATAPAKAKQLAVMMSRVKRERARFRKKVRRRPGATWRVLAHAGRNGRSYEMQNRGVFDELVVDDWFHIEQTDTRSWYIVIDGTYWLSIYIPRDPKKPVKLMQYDGPPISS